MPDDAAGFHPAERFGRFVVAFQTHAASVLDRIREHIDMPAARFTTSTLWDQANWSATTFRWHPTSEAPPVMGLVFGNAKAGRALFRDLAGGGDHTDEFEELRVSLIEGDVQGQPDAYSVHLCPDPVSLAARATIGELVLEPVVTRMLGRWNRMYPIAGSPPLLPSFKAEFAKHGEFLLAPVTRRQDGQLWLEPELGIIKHTIFFRQLSEITPEDPDAAAMVLPEIISPPR